LDREPAPLITPGAPQAQDDEQSPHPRASRLIAIVEDDDTLATTFQQVLEDERGWETVVLGDGAEAMRVLPETRPDMILLDVTLPGLDGVSLYRMLRGRRETWSIPILIVTASHEWELQRLGLEPGQLLRKPFELDDLLAAIERLLPDASDATPAAQDVS
jgi:two-component system, chemotaxis family, chemotaxis protein CheY